MLGAHDLSLFGFEMMRKLLQESRWQIRVMVLTFLGYVVMAPWQVTRAQASTELTLYGIVDTGVGYTKTKFNEPTLGQSKTESRIGMSSGAQSGSRWGLRIEESFNRDTAVIAILESGIFSNTGELAQNGIYFGRQSTLGLENRSLGRVDFGLQTNLASNYFLAVDPFVLGFGQANMGASFGSADTFRYSNLLLFQTPDNQPWRFGIGYSNNLSVSAVYLDSTNPSILPASSYLSNSDNLRGLTLGAKYSHPLLTLVASFDAAQAPKNIPAGELPYPLTPNSSPILKEWILGASFKTHPGAAVTWSAAIGQTFNGAFSGQTPGNNFAGTNLLTDTLGAQILFASGFNTNSYMLGFSWKIDSVQRLFGSWQAMQPNTNIATVTPLATAQTVSLAYTYNFSQRTNLYTWASAGKNFQMFEGNHAVEVGVGLRHLF
jgi:predicted porin